MKRYHLLSAVPFHHWYKENLTVSFSSVPGGGISPQTRPSDVLVIQGMGRSRWSVGDRGSSPVFDYGQKDFSEAIVDKELSSGDMLYIPKGFPHEVISS